MVKKIKITTELTAGRPAKAIDKANLPEASTEIKPVTGQLPKEIIGGHMGAMIKPPKPPLGAKGPAIKSPAKLPSKVRKGPPQ